MRRGRSHCCGGPTGCPRLGSRPAGWQPRLPGSGQQPDRRIRQRLRRGDEARYNDLLVGDPADRYRHALLSRTFSAIRDLGPVRRV